jgi:membrane protease YdiL (CAAX protease family)
VTSTTTEAGPWERSSVLSALLLLGFAGAVIARLLLAGPGPARSPAAGLVFAGLLLAMCVAMRTRVPLSLSAVGLGLGGAVLLCAPVALLRGGGPLHGGRGFASWALVVTIVAAAEELFLRGALYDAVRDAVDERAAILVAAVAFAALHVPLYGWHVVPLDLVVGLVLGELRRASGTPAAPAVTHVGADLAAWFLR